MPCWKQLCFKALLFVDDDLNEVKQDVGEISIMEADEGVITAEEIYKLCEALAVALSHIGTSSQKTIFSVSSKLQSLAFLCGIDMFDSERDCF